MRLIIEVFSTNEGYKSVETPADFTTVAHHVVRSEINYLKATIDLRTEQEKQDDL